MCAYGSPPELGVEQRAGRTGHYIGKQPRLFIVNLQITVVGIVIAVNYLLDA